MTLKEIFMGGSGVLVIILTLVQITPLKINPWSAICRVIGKALNSDVIEKLDKLEAMQKETRQRMDEHIYMDDQRTADIHRVQILRFNRELLQGLPHTHEDFIEAINEIDYYERYCQAHPEYENNRAVMAIANIKRCYLQWEENHNSMSVASHT